MQFDSRIWVKVGVCTCLILDKINVNYVKFKKITTKQRNILLYLPRTIHCRFIFQLDGIWESCNNNIQIIRRKSHVKIVN